MISIDVVIVFKLINWWGKKMSDYQDILLTKGALAVLHFMGKSLFFN